MELKTDEDIFKSERAVVDADPFKLIEHGFLTIKTKTRGLVKLTPNKIQVRFLQKVRELYASGKPVRVLILKARQAGLSTITEAIIYAFVSRMPGCNACVIADDLDGANYIFEMQKLYQEMLDEHLKPVIQHSNEKKLSFSDIKSQILIDTSDNPNAGRKFTFQFVHASEVSRFKRPLKDLMLGLGHAVPNAAKTMIFLETTAAGYEEFYDMWVKAINGKNDWVPLFYPWWEIEENSLPLEGGKFYPIEDIRFTSPSEKERFLTEEKEMKQAYGLTDEQINWRRWDIVNNCSGDINKFNQEAPACWQDAFVASGDLFFNRDKLKAQKQAERMFIGNIVKDNGRHIWRDDKAGKFHVYEMPRRGGQYCIGADPSEGLPGGDKSAAVVLDKRTNRTVCAYNHNVAPEVFEEDLRRMGHFYNEAMIACENKGYGYSVNQDLYKNYGKVYRKIRTKKGFKEPTLELGWNTNAATRPQMLAQMSEEVSEESTELKDGELISQCWTFINDETKGRPEAQKGKHDDLIFARAIAGQVRLQFPYKESFQGIKPPTRRFKGLSGY